MMSLALRTRMAGQLGIPAESVPTTVTQRPSDEEGISYAPMATAAATPKGKKALTAADLPPLVLPSVPTSFQSPMAGMQSFQSPMLPALNSMPMTNSLPAMGQGQGNAWMPPWMQFLQANPQFGSGIFGR